MIESTPQLNGLTNHNGKLRKNKKESIRFRSVASMCKTATAIISQLYNPIDTSNRFINLALQSLEEDSQSRQFLIDSKHEIRRASILLKRLIIFTKEMEEQLQRISQDSK